MYSFIQQIFYGQAHGTVLVHAIKKKKKVQDAVRLSYQDLDNENKLSIP